MVANLAMGRSPRRWPGAAVSPDAGRAGDRVAHLDGIRGVAVLAVVWYHASTAHLRVPIAAPGGYMGVDLFFVLSGFVITTILVRRPAGERLGPWYRRFVARRVRRLYPALIAMLVVVSAAAWIGWRPVGGGSARQVTGWAAIATAQGSSPYFAAHQARPNILSPTWTLSIEWMFYLVWPLILWRVRRTRRPDVVVGALAAVVYAISLLIPAPYWWVLPPARFAQLLAGAALALHQIRQLDRPAERRRVRRHLGGWVAAAAIVFWCVCVKAGPSFPGFRQIGPPVLTLSALALIRHGTGPGLLRAALSNRYLTAVGRGSYSVYLVHLPWLFAFGRPDGASPRWENTLLAAGAIAGTSLIFFQLFEKPYLRAHARPELFVSAGRA